MEIPKSLVLNSNLSLIDKAIYVVLKSYMNNKNHECFPSQKTISDKFNISIPTIRRSILNLKKEGYIKVNTFFYKNNVYLFNKYTEKYSLSSDLLEKLPIKLIGLYVVLQHVCNENPSLIEGEFLSKLTKVNYRNGNLYNLLNELQSYKLISLNKAKKGFIIQLNNENPHPTFYNRDYISDGDVPTILI